MNIGKKTNKEKTMRNINFRTMRKQVLHSAAFLFSVIFAMYLVGCSDDDDNDGTPTPPDEPSEVESAVLYGYRTRGPEGPVYYFSVSEDIPDEPDLANDIEIGAGWSNRVYGFDGSVYTWSGDASTLTKWNVDRTDLSISQGAVMSMAGVGISGNLGEPSFLSETQAYFFALPEGKVVEFNPTSMEIVEVIDVAPLVYEGVPFTPSGGFFYDVWAKYVSNGAIIMPVSAEDDFQSWTVPNKATVAIFDPASKTVTYNDDTRLATSFSAFPLDESGNWYQTTSFLSAFAANYGGHDTSSWGALNGLLKVNDDGSYDPDFFIDLSEVLNSRSISNVAFISDGKAVVSYKEPGWEFPEDWQDAGTSGGDAAAQVDLTTLEVTPFTALNEFARFGGMGTIDGDLILWARRTREDDASNTVILRQDANGSFTEVSEMIGGDIRVIRELW